MVSTTPSKSVIPWTLTVMACPTPETRTRTMMACRMPSRIVTTPIMMMCRISLIPTPITTAFQMRWRLLVVARIPTVTALTTPTMSMSLAVLTSMAMAWTMPFRQSTAMPTTYLITWILTLTTTVLTIPSKQELLLWTPMVTALTIVLMLTRPAVSMQMAMVWTMLLACRTATETQSRITWIWIQTMTV